MRQISSRRREEPTRGRQGDAANASYLSAPGPDAAQLGAREHPTAPRDFTAQVMARLSAPPAPPDPRVARARRARARARTLVRVYATLILVAALGVASVGFVAPWALVTAVVSVGAGVVALLAGAAYIARATGGFVSGFGVIYAVMLALLTPSLLMLAHRVRRQRTRAHQ